MRWQKKEEQQVYKGWRNMLRKTFVLPDGQEADFDILSAGDYVTVAAFTPQREVIVVKQFRPGPERVLTSFVEGAIDAGEDPAMTARRELQEETGFIAGGVFYLKTFWSAYTTQRQVCYVATDCRRIQAQQLDTNEFIDVAILPLTTFREMAHDPQSDRFTNVDCAYLALEYLNWL